MMKHTRIFLAICTGSLAIFDGSAHSQENAWDWKARLDSSTLVLSPRVLPTDGAGLDAHALLFEVAAGDSAEIGAVHEDNMRLDARAGTKLIRVAKARGRVQVVDDRGYDTTFSSPVALDDSACAKAAQHLLEKLGIAEAETVLHVRHLGASDRETVSGDETSSTVTVRRIATKVFFNRRIGGIRVIGDHIVVSYALDGSLRDVVGTWHPFDYSKGKMALNLSRASIEEKALDELTRLHEKRNLRLVEGTPIKLDTAYVPREFAPGQYTVDLRGIMTYEVSGPDHSSKVTQHVLEL